MSDTAELSDQRRDRTSSRVFGPPPAAVIAALVAAVVFALALEFLVIISFIGQRLWNDPRLFHDLVFTLPLIVWMLVVLATLVMVARIVTTWLTVDDRGLVLRGLFRRTVRAEWSQVRRVVDVVDVVRRGAEELDGPARSHDLVLVQTGTEAEPVAIGGRFFSRTAQAALVRRAEEHGVEVERIERATPAEVNEHVPHALAVTDRRPGLVFAVVALFYVAHNVLTFIIWGL
ncbi:hypothetical protein JSY14_04800 [Brachybacterium sp. EF45031]|uniref:hypothetical protein n=1 Tax=Brachybacterium sillae TaxID=2810536 RepID=UPI00217E45F5|nr:hypothetical protein [Brachybacterium sillae]MCS6711370.1 hypothetical protein [Brachybacterium sillae]